MNEIHERNEGDGVKAYYATSHQGEQIIRHLSSDAFGMVGARNLVGLQQSLKKDRKSSFRAVREMLRAFGFLYSREEILSISTGSGPSGESLIVITSIVRREDGQASQS